MLSHPARSFLAPVALATASVLALTPAVIAPTEFQAPPKIQVTDVALTGIGQDIYYAITPVVQEAVGGVSYLVNFVPLIGGPIAAQININYFQGLQPVIEATVNYLAAVVQDPFNVINSTANYGSTLYDIGYNWVSAEAVFFGLPPLPPLPQSAAAGPRAQRTAASRPTNPARGAKAAHTARPAATKPAKAAKAAASEGPATAKKATKSARATRGAAS